ncbi:MAG: hypothetical protein Q8J68_13945 [Methanolobus sp.]|uniref:hypothetical protein n=1 Tax=Methanolobus sp. TaxID=1874737 RepID=UPI0027301031|nr:hypothetical protein [Methanolobus sp.]MDP2218375.1 hypothetical protein [Methanolobus sp.]
MIDKVDQGSELEKSSTNSYTYLVSLLPRVSIIFFMLSLIYSLLLISKGSMPTLSVLVFSISLFSLLGAIYLLLEPKINYSRAKTSLIYEEYQINKILQITFFCSITIIVLILNNVNYVKPLVYYVFVGIAAVSVALQIALKSKVTTKDVFSILVFQILVLAVIIRASSLFLSPFHIGIDTHQFHYPHISQIIDSGYLSTKAYHYYHYPFFHLIQSIFGLLVGFSISHFKLLNLSHSLILIPIGYLIGTTLLDKKAGLMCSLLFSLSTMNIFIMLFSTSKIGGTCLLFLSFYFLLKQIELPNINILFLFFLSTIGLFFWHPEISASLFFILFSYLIVKIYFLKTLSNYSLFLLYSVFFISYQMYVSINLFNRIVESFFFINIDQTPNLIQNVAEELISMDFILQLFVSYLGISLPFFLVTYSILKKGKAIPKKVFLKLSLLLVCLIPVAGVFSDNFGLNPARLLTYISLISLIIVSSSIFVICNFKRKRTICVFTLVFFIFTIFSVSSYIAGDGSEIYNDNIPIRIIHTTEANVVTNTYINSKIPEDSIITTDSTTVGLSNFKQKVITSSDFNSTGYLMVNNYNIDRLNLVLSESFIFSKKNKLYTNHFNTLYELRDE